MLPQGFSISLSRRNSSRPHFFDIFCIIQHSEINCHTRAKGDHSSVMTIWKFIDGTNGSKRGLSERGAEFVEFSAPDLRIPIFGLPP